MVNDIDDKPKVNFYYSNEHDQGMGVPARCHCGGELRLERLGWTCQKPECRCGYGRDD
jgi:hypothetical protein